MAHTESVPPSTVPRVSETGVLVTVCATALLIGLNTTAMNTSVGAMAEEFDMSSTGVAWAVNGYLLASAAFVAPSGQFSDIFGRTRFLFLGLALFLVASLVIALSPGSLVLISGRGLQGLASALLLPAMLAILRLVYPPEQQGRVVGTWAAVGSLTFAIGPLYGGALTDTVGWRYIFWADVVFVMLAGLLAVKYVRPVRETTTDDDADWTGAVLLAGSILLFVLGIQQGGAWGWSSPAVIGFLAAAVILALAFVLVERRAEAPLVHFKLFGRSQYSAGVITTFAQGFGLMGLLYFVSIYAESYAVYDLSPLDAGLLLLPAGSAMFIAALVGGRVADRIGYRGPNTLAMVLIGVGALAVASVDADTSALVLAGLCMILAAGVGIGFSTTSAAGMVAVEGEVSGEAAGVINLARYLGTVLVVAIGTLLMFAIATSQLESSLESEGITGSGAIDLEQSLSETADDLDKAISDVAPAQEATASAAVADATVDGFRATQAMIGLVGLLAAVASWSMLKPHDPEDPPQDHRGVIAHPSKVATPAGN